MNLIQLVIIDTGQRALSFICIRSCCCLV